MMCLGDKTDTDMTLLIMEIVKHNPGGLMDIKSEMSKWYNSLGMNDKLKVVNRCNELMAEKGMILIGGKGTIKPDHELPHKGPESSKKKRSREREEKKIGDKCKAKAVGQMYLAHLKGEF